MTTALRPGEIPDETLPARSKHGSDTAEGISASELLARYSEAGFDRPTRASRRANTPAQDTVITQEAPAGLGPVGMVRGSAGETGGFGRNPRAVVATMGATMLGATAVMGVVTALDSPTDSPDADPQNRAVDLAGSESATMKLSVPQHGAGPARAEGQSAAGASFAKDLTQANGMVPAAFDQADAARIAANNLASAKKASEARAAAAEARDNSGDNNGGNQHAGNNNGGGRGGSLVPDLSSMSGGVGAKALSEAQSKLGKPYVWGADGPNAFDCSGLMKWAFEQVGKELPRSSSAQSEVGESVSKDELKPGDMVFFYSPVSHVGFYMGNGKILHASEEGEPVKISEMDAMPFNSARRV